MKIFDSHCHLDDRVYDKDMDGVRTRMRDAEVAAAMIVGVDPESSEKAVRLAEAHDEFFASVGVHPHDAKACDDRLLDRLRRLSSRPKVRAWGETGLDFNRMFSPRQDQEKWFIRQLAMAGDLGLPVILHERDSEGRFLEILKNHFHAGRKGVVHCFSGTREELDAYLDLGLHIGITGVITIKSRGKVLRALAPEIPADRLLVETDAPYLTPAPERNRWRRNEPALVRSVLFKLAEVRGEAPEALAAKTWENTCRLFNIEDV